VSRSSPLLAKSEGCRPESFDIDDEVELPTGCFSVSLGGMGTRPYLLGGLDLEHLPDEAENHELRRLH
jgi:hypothetical protein